MSYPSRRGRPYPVPTVVHNIVCQHRIEIEVWPSEADVYFQDEQHVDPLNTQVRFDAVVYNAPSSGVLWAVQSITGGSGAGSIDPTGLYTAPPKGSLSHGTTDIIVATAVDDPLRKAFARVTLVGFGPEPPLDPKLAIFPKQVYVYYQNNSAGTHNEFIDVSNKRQIFRALVRHSASTEVEWFVDTGSGYGSRVGDREPWYLYEAPSSGSVGSEVKVKAQLRSDPGVYDEAKIVLINYDWPGIA